MRRTISRLLSLLVIAAGLSACDLSANDDPVPTVAQISELPTAQFLTQNAPPPGFGLVNFDPVDRNLNTRQGWAYVLNGSFEGTFDDTGDPAEGKFSIRVWANELGEARRVVLQVEGEGISPDEARRTLEGVRLSNDYFIVDTNGECTVGGEGATVIADLSAGQIIGGVIRAVPTGHRDTLDEVPLWQYTFAPEDVRLPALHPGADSTLDISADLWIAPQYNTVEHFELVLTVGKTRVLWGEHAVSGTLILNYKLLLPDVDVQPNISVPNGC